MNGIVPLGYFYLVQRYALNVCELFCQSFATDRATKSVVRNGNTVKTYYPISRYRLDDSWEGQIAFALRYEGVNVEVLRAFFNRAKPDDVITFILAHPLGGVQRRTWFLYEYLTGKRLDIPDGKGGGYAPLVDDSLQYSLPISAASKERRYHILNNLIGNSDFSPFIRKTDQIATGSSGQLRAEANGILKQYSPELLYRAVQYLYVKETKSSFAIERETPDQRRMGAFVSILQNMSDVPITADTLVEVQNNVVDARYRQMNWRSDQVYVGETLAPGSEKVHYVAPRPDAVENLMDGYLKCLRQWMNAEGCDPVVIAAAMGFAFVFIHPFDDGNGRVHRFVIHAVLSQLGFIPHGLILPVSAVMLKHPLEYDKALESFSRRLLSMLDYEVGSTGEITVRNDSRDLYRAIDYTPIVEYFQQVVAQTIRTEWKAELDYLQRYDRIRAEMRMIVDMPEKSANRFIAFVQQNGGKLSKAKREWFSELTDEEITRLEKAVRNNTAPTESELALGTGGEQ